MAKKVRYGGADPFAKYEEAAGINVPSPLGPVQSAGVDIPEYTGPRPWKGEMAAATPFKPVAPAPKPSLFRKAADYLSGASAIRSALKPREDAGTPIASSNIMPLSSIPEQQKRSVRGSGAYTKEEIKQGYRKMGRGLGK